MKAIHTFPLLRVIVIAALILVSDSAGQNQGKSETSRGDGEAWSESDTRLANHYIRLLQQEPADGKVVDLLWNLYAAKDQTELLLDYFRSAAEDDGTTAGVILGHLLRRAGETIGARAAYERVLAAAPRHRHALEALAELHESAEEDGKALELYRRLIEILPPDEEDGLPIRLRAAELHRARGDREEAFAIWRGLLRAFPQRAELRSRIVGLLLESGETEFARSLLREQAESSDPRERLEALVELTRVAELLSDFEAARSAAEGGLEVLHFGTPEYLDLFSRLVRLHERFERLPELEAGLEAAASGESASEQALRDLAEFRRLTANSEAEEQVLGRLVAKRPDQLDYRLRLVRVAMRNDHYDEAAATLEAAFEGQRDIPLHLVLLRARIALASDRKDEALRLLESAVEDRNLSGEDLRSVIEFARENYLDSLVIRMLARDDGGDESAALELARFLHQRGRSDEAFSTLDRYVEAAGGERSEQAVRLRRVSGILRDFGEIERALEAIDSARGLDPDNVDLHSARANLLVEAGRIDDAIAQLESIWGEGETFEERADIDQRIFSLLRGRYSSQARGKQDLSILKDGNIQSLAQYRRLAAAASRVRRSGEEPLPRELLDYYHSILTRAEEGGTLALHYRAAWWALRLMDYERANEQLGEASEQSADPVVAVERMRLRLAERAENPTAMVRALTALIGIDPDSAEEYRQRRARIRFELGFEADAVRELERLSEKEDSSVSTLSTLAELYRRQGNGEKQLEVWRRAYRRANLFEKRRIVKQLGTALIENGREREAITAQLELIRRERDDVQRRKQLEVQLTTARSHFLLDWLAEQYRELARSEPFDHFYPEAVARARLAAGREEEAFEQMKKAYYLSNRDQRLLDELGQLADQLGDLRSAIYYRRQLLAREDGSLENWKSLVEMLEKDLQVEEADRIRRRLEGKFGRDPDFLTELAEFHLRDGGPEAARRILERILQLRSWDHRNRFRLALLLRDRGEPESALGHLEHILSETAGVTYPEELHRRAFPFVRVSTLSRDIRLAAGGELDPFIFSIEELPYLGGGLQDELADRLQETHPEFAYLPEKDPFLRLRAIEEGAELAWRLGRYEVWSSRQADDDTPLLERLWLARYGRDREKLSALVEALPASGGHFDLFRAAYLRQLCGEAGDITAWARGRKDVDPRGIRDPSQHPRSRYAVISAFLLLADAQSDPLLDREWVLGQLSALSPHPAIAEHIFEEFRRRGRYGEALELGELFAAGALAGRGEFLLSLSRVAGWVGRPETRERLLRESLGNLDVDEQQRDDRAFFSALTEMASLLEDDVATLAFLERLREDLEGSRKWSESARTARDFHLSLAAREYRPAIRLLAEEVDRHVESMRPRTPDPDRIRYEQIQRWQKIRQWLAYSYERVPMDDQSNREAFFRAFDVGEAAHTGQDSVRAEAEQFRIDREVLAIEHLPPPERGVEVERIMSLLRDPDSLMELARTLESVGFHAEAIPVYREAMREEPRDYAPLQGLFEACDRALDPEPALSIIERLGTREFPAPPGLTSEYISEQHARFLLHARDLERLLSLGQSPRGSDSAPPITSRSHIPYRAALIELYRIRGERDALLRVLREDLDNRTIEGGHLLLGAETLHALGRNDEALDWVDRILGESGEPSLERDAIRLAAEIHESDGVNRVEKVVELAQTCLERHPTNLTREISDLAHREGATEEAIAILTLLRRQISIPKQRAAISVQLLRMRREADTPWRELVSEWESCLENFGYVFGNFVETRESIREGLPTTNAGRLVASLLPPMRSDREEALEMLEGAAITTSFRWLHELVLADLRGELPASAAALHAGLSHPMRDRLLETLPAFGEEGVAAAREIVAASRKPGTSFLAHHPRRQLVFFHAIGDRVRLLEVHESLMREAESDLFHQTGLDRWHPSLTNRHRLPGILDELGESDLALRLYRRYHEGMLRYRWNHVPFLEEYLAHLIDEELLGEAETVATRVSAKTLGIDLRPLARLRGARADRGLDPEGIPPFPLSSGRTALLEDWRSVLAEGGEMVEYSDTW